MSQQWLWRVAVFQDDYWSSQTRQRYAQADYWSVWRPAD